MADVAILIRSKFFESTQQFFCKIIMLIFNEMEIFGNNENIFSRHSDI